MVSLCCVDVLGQVLAHRIQLSRSRGTASGLQRVLTAAQIIGKAAEMVAMAVLDVSVTS